MKAMKLQRNMMIFKLLRKLFGNKDMSYDFENIKVKAIEDKIQLKDNATTDGIDIFYSTS